MFTFSIHIDASCDLASTRTSQDVVSEVAKFNKRNAQREGRCQTQGKEPKGNQVDGQWQPGEGAAGVHVMGEKGWNGKKGEVGQEYGTEE